MKTLATPTPALFIGVVESELAAYVALHVIHFGPH